MNLHGKPLLRMQRAGGLRPAALKTSKPAAGLFVRAPDSPTAGSESGCPQLEPVAASLSPALFIGSAALRI
jgi:hypothetical protein